MDTQDRAPAIWAAEECPFTIEYSLRVVDDIRLAVTDAFFSLPRGGVEIGGILLGRHLPGRVTIEGYSPLECEHAFGPSFTLSPNDHEKLEGLIAEARRSSVTTPVGWYHSHTRSEVFFSAVDMEVHRRFFPERWQVALVVRPRTAGPTDAGFFFSEADGSIHGESSYAGFTLESPPLHPVRAAAPAPARAPRAPEPLHGGPVIDIGAAAPEPLVAPPIPADISKPPLHPELAETLDFPAARIEIPPSKLVDPDPETNPVAQVVEAEAEKPGDTENLITDVNAGSRRELHAPKFAVETPRSRAWMASIAITAGLAACAAGYQTRDMWVPGVRGITQKLQSRVASRSREENAQVPVQIAPGSSVGFNAIDSEGQLLLRWDRSSPLVQGSTGALLMISDGPAPPQAVGLDVAHLNAGSFTYARQTGHVDLTMIVHLKDGQDLREIATFLGQAPAVSTPPAADGSEPADQASKLQKQEARNKRLEKTVDDLRNQLKKERQRRRLENQAPDAIKK